MGTEGWKAGGSERFDDARIRKALERARRLHISVDGLEGEADADLQDAELDDAGIAAPAGAAKGQAHGALRPPPPVPPESGPWRDASPPEAPAAPGAGSSAGPAGGPPAVPRAADPGGVAAAAAPGAGSSAGPAGGRPAGTPDGALWPSPATESRPWWDAGQHAARPAPATGSAGDAAALRAPAGPGDAPGTPPGASGQRRAVGAPDRAFDGPAETATTPATGPERARPAWSTDLTSPGEARTGWARRVEAWLPDLAAAAIASGALVAPWLWLLAVAGLTLAVAVMVAGAAGIGAGRLPMHGLRRLVALLHPRSLLWAPVITARTVILAILLPAAVASTAWVLDEGAVGLAAAARAGAWAHALRVAAALVCFILVRGVGPGRARRADAVRQRLSEASGGTLGALAVLCVAVTAVVAGVVPRVDRERLSGADGLAWLPAGLRAPADRLRDRVVTTELDAVATCLTRRQPTGWNRDYTSGNPPGDADVGELVVARGEPDPADVVTAVTAAHNQLAPWVETIEVTRNGSTLVQVDRSRLPYGRPVTDGTRVVRAATAGRSLLEDGAPDLDRSTVLHCSAGPVL